MLVLRIVCPLLLCLFGSSRGWLSSLQHHRPLKKTAATTTTTTFLYLRDDGDLSTSNVTITTPSSIITPPPAATTTGSKNNERKSNDRIIMSSSSRPLQAGGGSMGDIMSPAIDDADLLFRDGLVTSEKYSLEKMYGMTHPLDRMAVTANGNLQRLVSSYYDAPVQVLVEYSEKDLSSSKNNNVWKRQVHMTVFDQTFCTATSHVQVHTPEVQALVESGKVGLGQLFRHLNVLPEFALQQAGPSVNGGGFWRTYTLDCRYLTCTIHETFVPHLWELRPKTTNTTNDNNSNEQS